MGPLAWAAPEKLRKPVNDLLNEDLMRLLALLIIPTVALPYLFTLSPAMLALFDALNYFIVIIFILEYGLKLYVAESRLQYFTNPWHLLDLAIIVLALAEFIPFVATGTGRASPMLRLLRLLRVSAAAGRSMKSARPAAAVKANPAVSSMRVNVLDGQGVTRCTMDSPACHIPSGGSAWIDLQEVSSIDLDTISKTLGIPQFILKSRVIGDSFPQIDYFGDKTAIFFWHSCLGPGGDSVKGLSIVRHAMLVVCERSRIITICTGKCDLFDRIVSDGPAMDGDAFSIRVLQAILKLKIDDWQGIVRDMEYRAMQLEELPVGRMQPSFLEDTFFLKKEARKIGKNLWHLRQVLDNLRSKKVTMDEATGDYLPQFGIFYDEIDYMYETVQNIIESLGSLRDLHINTASFEMTKVIKILSIITCLAVIPTTIGGLLVGGLMDVPYQLSIWEISLIAVSLMGITLYGFYKMGWLQ